ncbi:MAG: hypothetical protein ACOYJO_06005 [Eubacterium sp.]|jgi:hypothetical protein
MKFRTLLIIFAAIFVLHPFVSALIPSGVTLNLILCILTVIVLMHGGENESGYAASAILAGTCFIFIIDLCRNQHPGVFTLASAISLFIPLIVNRFLNEENAIIDALTALAVFFTQYSISWVIEYALGMNYTFQYMLRSEAASIIVNAAITFVIVRVIVHKVSGIRRHEFLRKKTL